MKGTDLLISPADSARSNSFFPPGRSDTVSASPLMLTVGHGKHALEHAYRWNLLTVEDLLGQVFLESLNLAQL